MFDPRTLDQRRRLLPGGGLVLGTLPDGTKPLMVRGAGPRIWDHTGRDFVDCVLGSGALILGHAHPEVMKAVSRQIGEGTTYYALNPPALALAERIVHHVPSAEQIQFCGSGGEAVGYALRLARAVTGRQKIFKFEGAFHGFSDYAQMSGVPSDPPCYPVPQPDTAGVPQEVSDTVLVAPFNDLGATARIISGHADRLAAVVVEPLQRAIFPEPGFLEGLRKLCTRHGIVLVFDEVVTGFRLGLGGAQGYYGISPDLTCLGKIIGGGFPMGAVTGPRSIMELAAHGRRTDRSVFMSGTLNGNPVSTTAGLATLEVLERPGVYARLFEIGESLRQTLRESFDGAGIPNQVIGAGPLIQVFLTGRRIVDYRDTLTANWDFLAAVAQRVVANGIFTTGQKMYLSLVHSEEDMAQIWQAWEKALDGLRPHKQRISGEGSHRINTSGAPTVAG